MIPAGYQRGRGGQRSRQLVQRRRGFLTGGSSIARGLRPPVVVMVVVLLVRHGEKVGGFARGRLSLQQRLVPFRCGVRLLQ